MSSSCKSGVSGQQAALIPALLRQSVLVFCCMASLNGCSAQLAGPAAPAGRPVDGELSLEEALADLDALAAPADMSAADFTGMKSVLRQQLLQSGKARWISAAPSDAVNRVTDLSLSRIDDFSAQASWTYRNVGDYDQNRQVNISDLTALGAGLGTDSSDSGWNAVRAADGDGNGEINISDITPLGAHMQNSVDGYTLQSSMTPDEEESWLPAGLAFFEDSSLQQGGGPRSFSLTVPAVPGQHFRVVPFSGLGSGIAGESFAYTGQNSGEELSFEQRQEVFELVAEKMDNLIAVDSDAQDEELGSFISSLPNIEEGGFFEGNAWGRFSDGRMLIVCKNLEPGPAGQTSAAEPPPPLRGSSTIGLPASEIVELYNAMGPGNLYKPPMDELDGIFFANGYVPLQRAPTVGNLKTTKDVGAMLLFTHGGSGRLKDATVQYGLWTDEEVTKASDIALDDDLDTGRLGYMLALNSAGQKVLKYFFTDSFVLEYMSFSDNSVVFLDACRSANASDMLFALHFKGASVCIGWSVTASGRAAERAAAHVFDRLLGANELSRDENPPIRPFDYVATLEDVQARGVSQAAPLAYPGILPEPEIYQKLVYHVDIGEVGQGFRLLAPSISYLNMNDASGKLQLHGEFGDFQGTVTVGGVDAPIDSWSSGLITCSLPASGPGSAGDVFVVVRDHASNVRQLSEWRGNIVLSTTGPGSLSRSVNFSLHLRADLGAWRPTPDASPLVFGGGQDDIIVVAGASDSSATVSSSGSHTDEDTTTSWSDAQDTFLQIAVGGVPTQNYITCGGRVDWVASRLYLHLFAVGKYHEKIENSQGTTEGDKDFGAGVDFLFGTLDGVPFELTAEGSIVSGMQETTSGDFTHRLSWEEIALLYPPDADAAK